MEKEVEKIDIDIDKVKEAIEENPRKKKDVQSALSIDRSTMSKILNKKRKLEGGELLTVAAVLNKNPFDFALQK